jgi:hypothetical protein
MFDIYTKITVPVSQEELTAITKLAGRELRRPGDQVRWMLRVILLGTAEEKAELAAQCEWLEEGSDGSKA